MSTTSPAIPYCVYLTAPHFPSALIQGDFSVLQKSLISLHGSGGTKKKTKHQKQTTNPNQNHKTQVQKKIKIKRI